MTLNNIIMTNHPPFPGSKYNNNKHNLFIFYKRWKNYNKIQLRKQKWNQTIEK